MKCPNCGSKNVRDAGQDRFSGEYFLHCRVCGHFDPQDRFEDDDDDWDEEGDLDYDENGVPFSAANPPLPGDDEDADEYGDNKEFYWFLVDNGLVKGRDDDVIDVGE